MSDSEDMRELNVEDRDGETPEQKKRRVQRACDICRKKKVKCDGPSKENGICTNCTTFHFECTYVEVAKKRGPPKGYIESLENRLMRMEKVLTRLAPGSDFTPELGARIEDRDSFDLEAHRQLEPPGAAPVRTRNTGGGAGGCSSNSTRQLSMTSRQASPNCATSEILKPWKEDGSRTSPGDYDDLEEDEIEVSLMDSLKHFTLEDIQEKRGFVGKSSGLHLIDSIKDFKYPGRGTSSDAFMQSLTSSRRRKYWLRPPWEEMLYNSSSLSSPSLWPPPDLIHPLIESYFLNTNTFFPILHRPTFELEFTSRLYETDRNFAGLCLTIFALGSRYVNDPRVSNIKADDELAPYAKGWCFVAEYFSISRSWGDLGQLRGIQALTLACVFTAGCSDPTVHWTLIGTALRACLDLGLHRRHVLRTMDSAQAELHKRTFWALYIMDRTAAGMLGRPVGIHDEDIDTEYPIDVDDEYWTSDDPKLNFQQPSQKPTKTTAAFIASIKLQQIAGYCLRTIYAINKSKMMLNFNTVESQQHIVAELDSGLNAWLDQMPKHLRWDPHNRNNIWFQQSALLYSTYYTTQIAVHRPFIPSPTKPSTIGFPSLAICTNAARSGTHVIDVARHREHFEGIESITVQQTFMFGVVLLVNVWGGKKSGSIGDPDLALKDVGKILALEASAENRLLFAGKLHDLLSALASQTNAPIQPPHYEPSQKRTRDTENAEPEPASSSKTPARRRSTTTRKPSASRAAVQSTSESSRPSSIHQQSPSSVPSPHEDSSRGSLISLEAGTLPPAFFPIDNSFSPDTLDRAMDPLNFLPVGQNPYGIPPTPQANANSLPIAPLNMSNFADFFPPTRDPSILAQQAQFFAFLQTQNQGNPQQQLGSMGTMPTPMQQQGHLPFPHHPSIGGAFPQQEQQQQQFQQHQQNLGGPSSSSNGNGSGQYGFEPGPGLDMSFFNPNLSMFGGGGGGQPTPSSNGNGGNPTTDSTTSPGGSWAAPPNGFEIDDWSSYLAGFSVPGGGQQEDASRQA